MRKAFQCGSLGTPWAAAGGALADGLGNRDTEAPPRGAAPWLPPGAPPPLPAPSRVLFFPRSLHKCYPSPPDTSSLTAWLKILPPHSHLMIYTLIFLITTYIPLPISLFLVSSPKEWKLMGLVPAGFFAAGFPAPSTQHRAGQSRCSR